MIQLKIDPEFRDMIPPLTDEEFEQLQENILEDGEVYEPIITWNSTIVDGHNRWKIICNHWDRLKDRFRIREVDFPDKWAAFDWMYRKQLGRRNLTEAQRTYMIGKLYEARKNTAAFKRNQHTERGAGQSDQHQNSHKERDETAGAIGKEFGVGRRTVRRASEFAKGVDMLKAISTDAAEKVLKGEADVTKADIRDIQNLAPESVEELAKAIAYHTPIPRERLKRNLKPGRYTADELEDISKTDAIIAEMYDTSTMPEYTLDLLIEDIQVNAEEFLFQLKMTLKERRALVTDESKMRIIDAIHHNVTEEAERVAKAIEDGTFQGPELSC